MIALGDTTVDIPGESACHVTSVQVEDQVAYVYMGRADGVLCLELANFADINKTKHVAASGWDAPDSITPTDQQIQNDDFCDHADECISERKVGLIYIFFFCFIEIVTILFSEKMDDGA